MLLLFALPAVCSLLTLRVWAVTTCVPLRLALLSLLSRHRQQCVQHSHKRSQARAPRAGNDNKSLQHATRILTTGLREPGNKTQTWRHLSSSKRRQSCSNTHHSTIQPTTAREKTAVNTRMETLSGILRPVSPPSPPPPSPHHAPYTAKDARSF